MEDWKEILEEQFESLSIMIRLSQAIAIYLNKVEIPSLTDYDRIQVWHETDTLDIMIDGGIVLVTKKECYDMIDYNEEEKKHLEALRQIVESNGGVFHYDTYVRYPM